MGKVNLRPDSFAEGGGLIDDFDGVISDARFISTDYEGKMSKPTTVAQLKFDIDGEEASEFYSLGGDPGDFTPNETGKGLDFLRTKTTITKTSKLGRFLESLVATGFPLNKMDTDGLEYLEGLNAHFLRDIMDLKGLQKSGDREKTVLLCTKINQLPWESTGKGKKGGKAKAKPVDEGLADTMAGIIQGIIIEKDGQITKKDVLSALFKHDDVKKLDDKKVALKLAADDTFLKGRDEWTLEDGILKMG